jgi:hypothetical protein
MKSMGLRFLLSCALVMTGLAACQTDVNQPRQRNTEGASTNFSSAGMSNNPGMAPTSGGTANVATDPTCAANVTAIGCYDCSCAAGLHCVAGQGCVPQATTGEACDEDSDCNTNNCSQYFKVCRVPVGQPCSASDCDRCLTLGATTYCSRECGGHDECNGGHCIGDLDIGYFTCQPPCEGCPFECSAYNAATVGLNYMEYCDCVTGCSPSVPRRPNGSPCQTAADCASDLCVVNGDISVCTQACTTSAECGAGLSCIGMPCSEGETEGCGTMCAPNCEDLSFEACNYHQGCLDFYTTESGVANVCSWKSPDNGLCTRNANCISGHCTEGLCVPAAGAPNGGGCAVPADCASQNCVAGECRGQQLLGQACTLNADCAVGNCCNMLCSTDC